MSCWICDQMEEYFLADTCKQAATNVNVTAVDINMFLLVIFYL